jgi:hypothetical protein
MLQNGNANDMEYPISMVHLYKERRRLYEAKKELKELIKSAIDGNSKAKFDLANRKPFKDGALALSSSKSSKKSSSSKLSTKNWTHPPSRTNSPRKCKANVAQNKSDRAAPQEPHASNAGGIESSTPLVSRKETPAKGKKKSNDEQNKQSDKDPSAKGKKKSNDEQNKQPEKDPSNVSTDRSEKKRGRQPVTDAPESQSKKSMLAPFAIDKHWALASGVLKHCVEFFGRN